MKQNDFLSCSAWNYEQRRKHYDVCTVSLISIETDDAKA